VRVWIDQAYCTGSGLCELIEPRVFAIGDDGLARVRRGEEVLPPGRDNAADVPAGCEDEVRDASESCPGGCIRLEPRPLFTRTYRVFPSSLRRTPAGRKSRGNDAVLDLANDRGNSTMRGKVGSLRDCNELASYSAQRFQRQVMLMGASETTSCPTLPPA
jgi:ferredoxin